MTFKVVRSGSRSEDDLSPLLGLFCHFCGLFDWVKKCMEYEVEGARSRGRPKKTWREIVEKDCQAHGLNRRMP